VNQGRDQIPSICSQEIGAQQTPTVCVSLVKVPDSVVCVSLVRVTDSLVCVSVVSDADSVVRMSVCDASMGEEKRKT
jgi:hypothetical protein